MEVKSTCEQIRYSYHGFYLFRTRKLSRLKHHQSPSQKGSFYQKNNSGMIQYSRYATGGKKCIWDNLFNIYTF